jgi:hypothetical protein
MNSGMHITFAIVNAIQAMAFFALVATLYVMRRRVRLGKRTPTF